MRRYTVEVGGSDLRDRRRGDRARHVRGARRRPGLSRQLASADDVAEAVITPGDRAAPRRGRAAPALPPARARDPAAARRGGAAAARRAAGRCPATAAGPSCAAPMPGTVVSSTSPRATASTRGQLVLKLEAMKMMNAHPGARRTRSSPRCASRPGQTVGYGDAARASCEEAVMGGDTLAQLLQGVAAPHAGRRRDDRRSAGLLVYLAVAKEYEPMLLLPIGAGCILANLPLSPLVARGRAAQHPLPDGRRQRAVPAADLRRHRRDDRLRPAAREPAHDAARRGRAVRHLRHAAAGARPRLHS